jgi:hypothetical protein
MNLINLVKRILNINKEIDTKKLPSQGLFYNDDFKIYIKKADVIDIIEYEFNYVKSDIGVVIEKLKKVVDKNTTFSNGYKFNDIKSIDVIFLFFEIVNFTKNKSVSLSYLDDNGNEEVIEFNSKHFNYFIINDDLMNSYNKKDKEFDIDGYKYTLPSIGVENSLTNYLISKSNKKGAIKYNSYNYSFTYFLGKKNVVSFPEIDNLIQIFNFDMDDNEIKKVNSIVNTFLPIQKYSLKKGNDIIDINSKINLEKIWK